MATLTSVRSSSPYTPSQTAALDLAVQCAHLAEEHKARDILVLDMRGLTPLYDFMVIATGVGKRLLHGIAEEIDDFMKAKGEVRLGQEGYEACRWIVQDYGHVVVHLFDSVSRAYYGLEDLWADAPRVEWGRM
jgi:ribosome-associated protein